MLIGSPLSFSVVWSRTHSQPWLPDEPSQKKAWRRRQHWQSIAWVAGCRGTCTESPSLGLHSSCVLLSALISIIYRTWSRLQLRWFAGYYWGGIGSRDRSIMWWDGRTLHRAGRERGDGMLPTSEVVWEIRDCNLRCVICVTCDSGGGSCLVFWGCGDFRWWVPTGVTFRVETIESWAYFHVITETLH